MTVFRAPSLPLTVCETKKVESIYEELIGTELFGVPIFQGDRAASWPGLELAKTFKIFGKSAKESSYDVVLSSAGKKIKTKGDLKIIFHMSLGWVSINCGLADYHFQAWTPEKRGVHIRDCLLPKAVQLRGSRVRYSVAYRKHKLII